MWTIQKINSYNQGCDYYTSMVRHFNTFLFDTKNYPGFFEFNFNFKAARQVLSTSIGTMEVDKTCLWILLDFYIVKSSHEE